MAQWNLFEDDLAPLILALAKSNLPKGSSVPVIQDLAPYPFNPYLGFTDKQQKLYDTDAVLKSKLKTFRAGPAKVLFDAMMARIKDEIVGCAKDWKASADNKAAYNMMMRGIETQVTRHGGAIQDKAAEIAETYFAQVQAGKVANTKYKAKIFKGGVKTIAAVGGVGVAIAGAVGSHGATTPAVVLACWAVYKSGKETFDTYKAWTAPIEDYEKSIKSTIETLDDKYIKGTDKAAREAFNKGAINWNELVAKGATEFVALSVKSLKSLEGDIKNLKRHVDMGFVDLSKQGKKIGEMKAALKGMRDENIKARDHALALQKQLPANLVKGIIDRLDKSDKLIAGELARIPKYIEGVLEAEKRLKKIRDDDIPAYQDYCDDLKAKRSGWVKKSSIVMRLVPVALSAACMDMSTLAAGGIGVVGEVVPMLTGAISDLAQIALAQARKK